MALNINGLIICIMSLLISIPGALYFDNNGSDLITLNFTNWTGYDFSGENPTLFA